jgi:hypothetical protein
MGRLWGKGDEPVEVARGLQPRFLCIYLVVQSHRTLYLHHNVTQQIKTKRACHWPGEGWQTALSFLDNANKTFASNPCVHSVPELT